MVGLWRCTRGKCIERVANRIVTVVSMRLVGSRRCARGKSIRVANRIVTVALGGRFAAQC